MEPKKKLGRWSSSRALLLVAGVSVAALAGLVGTGTSSGASPRLPGAAIDQGVYNYVQYTDGTNGPANEKLAPYVIGYMNTQNGSVPPRAPQATTATQFAVKYINQHLGGIDGHPIKLSICFVENSEQDGLGCAQQFLNNHSISVIMEGGVSVGGNTLDETNNGKDVIFASFGDATDDSTAKNVFQLYTSHSFGFYAWGTFGRNVLHATSNAVLYDDIPGSDIAAKSVKTGSEASGIKTTLVSYDHTSSDLIGALEAAGAATAGMITPLTTTPSECTALINGMHQLGIDPNKGVGQSACALPQEKASYWNGDYPTWYYVTGNGGDAYTNDKAGVEWRRVLKQYGFERDFNDNYWQGMFGQALTTARFLNQIAKGSKQGVGAITPKTVAARVKAFRGPLLLGARQVHCGEYPKTYPNVCTAGDFFSHYKGNGKYSSTTWVNIPVKLQKKLGAISITH